MVNFLQRRKQFTIYSSVRLCRAHCPSLAADGKPALHSLLCEVLSTPALQMLIATAPLCPPFKWGDKKKVCHEDHRDTKDEGRIKNPREFVRWITMSRGKESLGHKEPSCGRVREPPLWQRAAARGEERTAGSPLRGHGRACSAPARPLPAAGTALGTQPRHRAFEKPLAASNAMHGIQRELHF